MFTDHLSLIIISVSAHACSLQTQLLCYIDSSDLHSGTTAFYYYFTIAPKHPVPAQGHSAVSTDQRKIGSSLFPPYKQSHEVKPTSLNLHDILACHINRTYPSNMLHVFIACSSLLFEYVTPLFKFLQYVQTCLDKHSQQHIFRFVTHGLLFLFPPPFHIFLPLFLAKQVQHPNPLTHV